MTAKRHIEEYIRIPEKILRGIRTITWESAESDFGGTFPEEFMRCINLYGIGYFSGFLFLHSPIDIVKPTDTLTTFADKLKFDRLYSRNVFLDYHEFYFPEGDTANHEDLTFFGSTIDGDMLYWLGNPRIDGWSIYIFDRSFLKFSRYDIDIEEFIIKLTEGEIILKEFPDDAFNTRDFVIPVSESP